MAMPSRGAFLVAILVLFAGCAQAPSEGPDSETTTEPAVTTTVRPPTTDVPTATPGRPTESPTETTARTSTATATPTPQEDDDPLGWESGYWYNASLSVNASDGLNRTELDAVAARSMARIERLRRLEFTRDVPIKVISRAAYRERYVTTNRSPARRTFENGRFEALFLVGEDEDALAVRERNRGEAVLGLYFPGEDRIVLVAEDAVPVVSELVLAHELFHGLQDARFGLEKYDASTLDRENAVDGLIEGDARYLEHRYGQRCAEAWSCVIPGGGGGTRVDHWGRYLLSYFPYSDGPAFVRAVNASGGWERVNALYGAPPSSAEQVIYPAKYGREEPRDVRLPDRSGAGWSQVSDEDTLGQPALVSMFAYPAFEDSRDGRVIDFDAFLTGDGDGLVNQLDPFDYNVSYASGWDGDRLRVYESETDETGYVWRLAWDSPAEAREFARGYRELLRYWGGARVNGTETVWLIDEGSFADAFAVRVDGDTVTVVNAPDVEALDAVHARS